MKTIIQNLLFLALISSFSNFAMADTEQTPSHTVWIDTNSVLISNAQNIDVARRDCETTMRILGIMSNDKIVFRSNCEQTYNPRCNFYYCYQLNVKALVINEHNLDQ